MKAERTRSQERILKLLKSLNKAISAQDIYVELRNRNQSVGLATVYRALEALKLEGVVQVRTLASGESLYSSVQQDKHHLTCLQCGRSIAINQCPVHDLETQLHQAHQFKIFYHTLEFFGLCNQCQMAQATGVGAE
ncbi:Fur family transcriptional regulator [Chroogloeocystis siderophila]|jgi:Fur family ferric uptake transcriptional regulator|uniref:Transcriptional repressor n=1 Tax=Chroogloeocystis siderophila 5.2 s.c.1 TaxID=247279 RepID=A0A1U7HM67_9CHRO|nr:Fur family transcriptional regulator [Chroogloeocystis siderophila]OKH24659.1 transcriptional repressor [Chroogloeocystis siderophila 5.2 s.c.1]